MGAYVIRELPPGARGGYCPRGAVKVLWENREPFEVMVAGPADTGKTWGCLSYANALLWKYPGAQGVILRKTYAALVASALRTYLRISGDTGIKPYGGEKPEWFDYPNGSRLWVAGLDNAGKALSTERDFVYVNQAEELTLGEWEILTTRCSGRGAVMPYTRCFGDCNPGPPFHWIKQRVTLRLLESRHEDNPDLFDEAGQLTAGGARRLEILDALTGARKERLRYGRWVQQEGVVYEGWDRAVHVLDRMPAGWQDWRKLRSVDFGYTNPFCCQWWAVDGDGRMYLYRELYRTGRLVRDHAADIRRLSGEERYEVTVADHDAEDRATLHAEGILTQPAHKAVTPGLQAVARRLHVAPDGKPRLYVVEGALAERDESLAERRQPLSTEQEFEVYAWPKGQDGRPLKEEPVKLYDHGMDAARYATAHVDGLGPTREYQVT